MLNSPRHPIVRSWLARGAVTVLLGIMPGCGASSPVAPTAPIVTSAPAATAVTYSVTAGATVVAPGAQLSVSWTASIGGGRDTIALFKKGDASTVGGWWRATGGATAGTFTLTAPGEEGQYEFRYLLDDEVTDTARSGLVTVTSQ